MVYGARRGAGLEVTDVSDLRMPGRSFEDRFVHAAPHIEEGSRTCPGALKIEEWRFPGPVRPSEPMILVEAIPGVVAIFAVNEANGRAVGDSERQWVARHTVDRDLNPVGFSDRYSAVQPEGNPLETLRRCRVGRCAPLCVVRIGRQRHTCHRHEVAFPGGAYIL